MMMVWVDIVTKSKPRITPLSVLSAVVAIVVHFR